MLPLDSNGFTKSDPVSLDTRLSNHGGDQGGPQGYKETEGEDVGLAGTAGCHAHRRRMNKELSRAGFPGELVT